MAYAVRINRKKTFYIICILITLYCAFLAYQIRFGRWVPEGRQYQENAFNAEAKTRLLDYYQEQMEYFKAHQKFSSDLHLRADYSNETTNFKFGFSSEQPQLAKYCSDCELSDHSFKLGAVGSYKGNDVVWVIDDKGKMVNLRPIKD